jgi:hypothetical protein
LNFICFLLSNRAKQTNERSKKKTKQKMMSEVVNRQKEFCFFIFNSFKQKAQFEAL